MSSYDLAPGAPPWPGAHDLMWKYPAPGSSCQSLALESSTGLIYARVEHEFYGVPTPGGGFIVKSHFVARITVVSHAYGVQIVRVASHDEVAIAQKAAIEALTNHYGEAPIAKWEDLPEGGSG